MRVFKYTIKDELGIHARPSVMLAKEAKTCVSKIIIEKNKMRAEAIDLMAVMGLNVRCGDLIIVEITGEDEDIAYGRVRQFFENSL